MAIGNVLRAREVVKTVTQYGPLPEVRVSGFEWMVLALAITLVAAALLELFGFKVAAPLALGATLLLWIYFGLGLWAQLTSDGFVRVSGRRAHLIPWQQIIIQFVATLTAIALTYVRYRTEKSS